MAKGKDNDSEANEEAVKPKIKATPILKNGDVEPAKAKDIGGVDRSSIIEDRYIKVKKIKCIVTDQSGQNKESFTTISPQAVSLAGYDGEYLDLDCSRYVEVKGLCGEEIEINQFVYENLRGSTRPVSKRVKGSRDGEYSDVTIKVRNWAIEQVEGVN